MASVESTLRVAALGLTLSAQAAMPKPTRQNRLGVPSARVAKAKGKGMVAEVKSKGGAPDEDCGDDAGVAAGK